jgi:hypothetical protein
MLELCREGPTHVVELQDAQCAVYHLRVQACARKVLGVSANHEEVTIFIVTSAGGNGDVKREYSRDHAVDWGDAWINRDGCAGDDGSFDEGGAGREGNQPSSHNVEHHRRFGGGGAGTVDTIPSCHNAEGEDACG